nr:glycerol-3-phosphate acyltransferase [Mycoplasmopsis bovis]
MINLALFLVGYLLLGSFNTSIILSRRVKNDDIREHNSKNAGATNSLRTYGTKFALAVFAADVLKTLIPILIIAAIVNHIQAVKEFSLISYISPQAIGLGVVLGHIFPIYYKFKGGKGAACTVGLIISINIIFVFDCIYNIFINCWNNQNCFAWVNYSGIFTSFICLNATEWFKGQLATDLMQLNMLTDLFHYLIIDLLAQ